MDMGINRNIVECKVRKPVCSSCHWCKGINRNIVECKAIKLKPGVRLEEIVLIETLWNVKYEYLALASTVARVLIETLWNVKETLSCLF